MRILRFVPVLCCLLASGCVHYLAERAVRAPNLSQVEDEKSLNFRQIMAPAYFSRQFTVSVGPPPARIAVWVTDPTHVHEQLSLAVINHKLMAMISRPQPMTNSTSAPATSTVPKGTIIMLHGIGDSMDLGPYVIYREMLTHKGYRVVQVDLRGHGQSTGEWISYGVFESHDMVQVLDELENRGEIVGEVGALGISYGGAVAIQWAAIDPRIKAIVALEPFANMRDAALDAAPLVLGKEMWLFSHKDLLNAIAEAGKLAGFNPDDADAVRAIAKTQVPVLIVHSRSDEFISYQQSERLHAAALDHSRLVLVEDNSHFNLMLKSMDLIRWLSVDWFNHFLCAEPTTQPTTGS